MDQKTKKFALRLAENALQDRSEILQEVVHRFNNRLNVLQLGIDALSEHKGTDKIVFKLNKAYRAMTEDLAALSRLYIRGYQPGILQIEDALEGVWNSLRMSTPAQGKQLVVSGKAELEITPGQFMQILRPWLYEYCKGFTPQEYNIPVSIVEISNVGVELIFSQVKLDLIDPNRVNEETDPSKLLSILELERVGGSISLKTNPAERLPDLKILLPYPK